MADHDSLAHVRAKAMKLAVGMATEHEHLKGAVRMAEVQRVYAQTKLGMLVDRRTLFTITSVIERMPREQVELLLQYLAAEKVVAAHEVAYFGITGEFVQAHEDAIILGAPRPEPLKEKRYVPAEQPELPHPAMAIP